MLDNLDITKLKGSATPMTMDSLPGLLSPNKDVWNPKKFRVRYQKLNMDELSDITELECLETRAIRDEGVYVMSKKEFLFMDKVFILVQYMEKDDEVVVNSSRT